MSKKLLIVEDDPGLQSQLRWCFSDFEVFLADDEESALRQIEEQSPQVVTLDLGLPPDAGGVSVGFLILEKIISINSSIKVIVVTGQEDRENALKAVSMGAYDFFNKPVDAKILSLVVDRAYRLYEIEQENQALLSQQQSTPLSGILTSSSKMLGICDTVEKVAPSDLSVLVLGESGTGKELIARAVHDLSHYSEGNFVAINCAAIPENLLESELFGHEKGSFTGASGQKKGKVEVANGGTLFLDEIGDMPMDLQAKMLRFLQERVIERVGGIKEIPIDTRVICATHRPLGEMIKQQLFREDLYFRISDININLPPLRDRGNDILLLSKVFLDRYTKQQDKTIKGFSQSAENTLLDYECRGNIRELDKIIRRAVIMSNNTYIQPEDLLIESSYSGDSTEKEISDSTLTLAMARNIAEKRAIERVMQEVSGNISKAAKLLDVSRPTLYSLIERLGIDL
ncbi:MAG: PEP-CTERM-box response regulator transcription factor [Gammaproteobacteria bacterium]|nr:PEP-CTERM-box response regulator transcription factor [Gammaproteobacteria bacterium]